MKIATIVDKGVMSDNILILQKNEAQVLHTALKYYVDKNPRKKTAKELLKAFDSDLECW